MPREETTMASDDLKLDGVTLSLAECEEVLAWVAEPCSSLPGLIYHGTDEDDGAYVPWVGPANRGESRLTPDLVELIRDHVMPWAEVECQHIQPGTPGKYRGIPGRVMQNREFASDDGSMFRLLSECDLVKVRRRRKPTLTLRDVEPGQRFRFAGPIEYSDPGECLRTMEGFVDQYFGHSHARAVRDLADTPVTLIEGDDAA